uniref:Uncharacterized protein n=1 Tax=Brassica oleracea var. oleracea TaxID=109376 RepID=A0A0D3D3L6_BRAOL
MCKMLIILEDGENLGSLQRDVALFVKLGSLFLSIYHGLDFTNKSDQINTIQSRSDHSP